MTLIRIKEAAEQHHPAYDENAWQKMEKLLNQHLPQRKDDRRKVFFFAFTSFDWRRHLPSHIEAMEQPRCIYPRQS